MKLDSNKPTKRKALMANIGEERAFDFFFRQYYTSLCFFANSILHNLEESKDIVQDCFAKLWEVQKFQDRTETIKSLLYAMVRNRCIDNLRKRKLKAKAITNLSKEETSEEYFDELVFAEMIRQVFDYIEELPETMQRVLKMHYLQGKKYKEIADTLQTSPDAIRMQKNRALKIIRRKFPLLFNILLLFFF